MLTEHLPEWTPDGISSYVVVMETDKKSVIFASEWCLGGYAFLWCTTSENADISLVVPIWSSGERRAKVKQAQIAYEQIEVQQDQLKVQLGLQYQTAINEYFNAFTVYQNRDRARKVAAKIFQTTSIKFSEGMASSIDILNTQNQFLDSEKAFINSGRVLLRAGQELERLLTKSINP